MVKLSERLKNTPNIEDDNDICRLIILEMKRFSNTFDYFQLDNAIDLMALSNYFDLNIKMVDKFPVTAKLYFDYNLNLSLRLITCEILDGEIECLNIN